MEKMGLKAVDPFSQIWKLPISMFTRTRDRWFLVGAAIFGHKAMSPLYDNNNTN